MNVKGVPVLPFKRKENEMQKRLINIIAESLLYIGLGFILGGVLGLITKYLL